jgi:alpha-1,6-mannosyltransferase
MHADPLSAYAYRFLRPVMSREAIDRRFEPFWKHLRELGQSFDRVVCASGELQNRLAAGGVANTVLHPMGIDPACSAPAAVTPCCAAVCWPPAACPKARICCWAWGVCRGKALAHGGRCRHRGQPVAAHRSGHRGGGKPPQADREPDTGQSPYPPAGRGKDRQKFATLLASADALIHGCEAETFCMAAAEARASGVPVIVPDRGGAADHARGGAGITYRSGSALAASQATLRLLHNPPKVPFASITTTQGHFEALFADYESVLDRRRAVA